MRASQLNLHRSAVLTLQHIYTTRETSMRKIRSWYAIAATLAIFVGMTFIGTSILRPFIWAATAPGQRAHSLARATLPGGDLALVVVPAQLGRDGAIALWWAGVEAPRVRELLHVVWRAGR